MQRLAGVAFAVGGSLVGASILPVVLVGGLALAGCGDDGDAATSPSVTARYVLIESPTELAEADFFDHPFPSDARLDNGRVRYAGYYNPYASPILAEYIGAIDGVLDGFSPVAAGHLRFTGPLDPATLPDPGQSVEPGASVQLIDVDPSSPTRGERQQVQLLFRRDEGVYWRDSTLAFMPSIGFPLQFKTRYALVVTDSVRAEGGGPVEQSVEVRQALGLDEPAGAAASRIRDELAPAIDEVESAGVPRERIVHLTVFTTNDPTEELFAGRDEIHRSVEAPDVLPGTLTLFSDGDDADEYQGEYGPSPNFQSGELPFTTYGDGGGFVLDGGVPQVVDTFDLRFSLTVPDASACPMPQAGYPVVLYAHGTLGDWRSYSRDGTAGQLAKRCVASMGVDQIFHGTRPGAVADESQTQVLFFNFMNVEAARHNIRQSGLDEVQRARLFTETQIVIPASVSATGQDIRFDPNAVLFMGHSQGGLNGPLYLASDDSARGGVLSGASSMLCITLLEKSSPAPSIAGLVKSVFLGLKADSLDEASVFHPPIAMAQAIVDVVDPIHYAQSAIRSPRDGFAPKSVYVTEGVNPDGSGDTYAPVRGTEALAMAYGLPLQEPAVWAPPDAAWGGLERVTIPAAGLSGNLADGKASGVLAQWSPPPGGEGHFVVFDVAKARDQAAEFLKNLADDPVGRVPAP